MAAALDDNQSLARTLIDNRIAAEPHPDTVAGHIATYQAAAQIIGALPPHHWLEHIAARRVRARTLESYESVIRMHITPNIGGQRLDRLQPEHLEQVYNLLLERGLG